MQTAPNQVLLIVNSGSSSIKFAIYRRDKPLQLLFRGRITGIGKTGGFQVYDQQGHAVKEQTIMVSNHGKALGVLLNWLAIKATSLEIVAAGHRVVHGGSCFHEPVLITDNVITYLESLIPLAPNHQPASLQGIATLQRLQPAITQIACFDTAFHHGRPEVEQKFALPSRCELDAVRRYGFHGLSYQYIAKVLPDYLGEEADGKVIVAHLGHGASLCALHERRSVATTMTFTPLDGIPMGTRCGAIDPAVVLYLQNQGMTADEVSDLLYFQSGLLGVSGETDNMAELLGSSSAPAQRAIAQFVHHTARAIGSLAAALEGLDALVFTAGIGEHAAPIRAAISERCEWLGLELDADANTLGQVCISKTGSLVQTWIIPTDEEQVIAEHTLRLINEHGQGVSP